jgi:outer membrane lipoprotein-sorting protein
MGFATRTLTLCCALAALACAQDLTIDQLVEKNTAALGGAEAIQSINTLKMSGKLVLGGGAMEAPMTMLLKRPNLMRLEIQIQGRSVVQALDGAGG